MNSGMKMTDPVKISATDPIIEKLNFKAYKSIVERPFKRFEPEPDQPQETDIVAPWGETLTAKAGDYLISEADDPEDSWPVDADIFESTYTILRPGVCVKKALTHLVPMTDLTGGDPDQEVMVSAIEGPQTVRAGDFYLAKGIQGEIWSYPKEKVGVTMIPVK
jgi:hypothetical protein